MMQSNERYRKIQTSKALRNGDGTAPTGDVGGGIVGAGRTPISASNIPMPNVNPEPSAMDQVSQAVKTGKQAYDLYDDFSKAGAATSAASTGSGMFGAGTTGGAALSGAGDAFGTTQAANTGMNLGGWSGGAGTTAGTVGTGSGAALGSGGSLAGGTTAGTTGTAAGSGMASALGKGMGYAGLAMQGLGLAGNIGKEQGAYDRDKGSFGGQLSATGQGAASGYGAGPIGAIVGAALGNESYQYEHGNRKGGPLDLNAWKTSDGLKDKLAYALKGGAVGADVSGWLGLN